MSSANQPDVTRLLGAIRAGDPASFEALFRVVYDELHRRAHFELRDGPSAPTLSTTALVHEAYLKLTGTSDPDWENRRHFFRVAARAMRQIVVDAARRRMADKRGGGEAALDLDALEVGVESRADEFVALEEALSRLEDMNPRLGQVVELRFFAGLSVEETAEAMETSERTVKRDWRLARAFLHGALTADGEGGEGVP